MDQLKFRVFGLVALALVLSGCNGSSSPTCNISGDQQGTFMAKVASFPIPVSVDTTFSSAQQAAIQEAVQQWNTLGNQIAGTDFFSIQTGDNYQTNVPDIGTCGSNLSGSDTTLYMVNEPSQQAWTTLEQSHSVPNASSVGVTFRCTLGDQAQRQVTALDSASIGDAQFSSVALHELGHGLGLDHSCNAGAGSSTFTACQGLPSDHPYVLAVMYPSLQMPSDGEAYVQVKDHLQSNDIDRTQCMYGSN